MLLLSAGALIASAATARAYSSFGDYTRAIQEGGGGGRLFTGTPADGYGCKVCHRGAEGAKLEVVGLPEDGYEPGRSYEIALLWPATTPHTALMAELTDAAGRPAGVTALAPYATWQLGERCVDNGFPAADVCRKGGAGDGCCRDMDPTRDSCSFPGERSVLWVLDCGSRFARVVWTAPAAVTGDVWFSTEMVTSNLQNDARGDGVTSVRRLIRPAGTAPELTTVVGDCRSAPPGSYRSGSWGGLGMFLLLFVLRRPRKRDGPRSDMNSSDRLPEGAPR
jgi:hypothetical protein